jgi:NhaP-type Na+/H+ or K+/H+ antiporter
MLIIIIIGRGAAVFISYYAFACFPGNPQNKMTVNQLCFLVYAALIRGSIAFGLILKMDDDFGSYGDQMLGDKGQRDVIQSTTAALVIITTIVYGATTNFMQKLLLPNKTVDDEVDFLSEDTQMVHKTSINEEGNFGSAKVENSD